MGDLDLDGVTLHYPNDVGLSAVAQSCGAVRRKCGRSKCVLSFDFRAKPAPPPENACRAERGPFEGGNFVLPRALHELAGHGDPHAHYIRLRPSPRCALGAATLHGKEGCATKTEASVRKITYIDGG